MCDIPRETALRTLYDIDKNKAYSNVSLDRHMGKSGLKGLDSAFVTELVHGVLKRRLTIDYIISQFIKMKPEKMSIWINNILRLGVYQLVFLSKIPVSAAVNESVKLAKKFGHAASANFVNAVLRNIVRNKAELKYPDESEVIRHLSIKHSYPEWLVEQWAGLYGREFAEALLQAGNEKPDYIIRVNILRTEADELIKRLGEKGFQAHKGKYLDDTLTVVNPSGILATDEFNEGLFIVQDESSLFPVRVLNPQPGQLLIDVCSAPGGKAAYAASLMRDRGRVIAQDIYQNKLEMIKSTADRLSIKSIEVRLHDASAADPGLKGMADYVLADVPCTGFGIIRRKPDIKWTRKPEDIAELTALQRKILKAGAEYLKPGGAIVYSTCTINPAENENVINDFLNENPQFALEDFDNMLPEGIRCLNKGMLQLYPNVHGTDGFFVAKLRRTGA